MMFNSMQFALFFPLAVLLYFIIPHKARTCFLLVISYFYYMCWNPKYALLLLASTAITFVTGLFIGKEGAGTSQKKLMVFVSFFLNLAILGFFKYFNFAADSIVAACRAMGVNVTAPAFDILLPVGISFYIFQALSYTMDVYRGEIKAEHDFFKYALFVSFFPQLVAGPIERSKNLLDQFDEVHTFEYRRVAVGLSRMLWGFFLKLVIAQRLSIVADLIYGNSQDATGYQLCVGTFAFAFQIYCDFASYSEIAIGASQVMGFRLMENFKQPFFATSCHDLWNRWHISLNSWFRDYLYFPLGGSRVPKWRKHLNIMIVFLVSGLWHGAAWTYVIWGGLSGLFQVLGAFLKNTRAKIGSLIHLEKGSVMWRILSTFTTFLFFNFSLVFFRSENVGQAMDIMGKIFTKFGFASIVTTSPFSLGLGVYHMLYLLGALLILLLVDIWKEKGHFFDEIMDLKPVYRYGIYLILILMILGSATFSAAEFIYFQF